MNGSHHKARFAAALEKHTRICRADGHRWASRPRLMLGGVMYGHRCLNPNCPTVKSASQRSGRYSLHHAKAYRDMMRNPVIRDSMRRLAAQ